MKRSVIRCIVTIIYNKNYIKLAAETVGHIYDFNGLYVAQTLKENDTLLGIIIDNRFNICYDAILDNGHQAFGYFIGNDNKDNLKFQLIEEFDNFRFNQFEASYKLGRKITIAKNEIEKYHFSKEGYY